MNKEILPVQAKQSVACVACTLQNLNSLKQLNSLVFSLNSQRILQKIVPLRASQNNKSSSSPSYSDQFRLNIQRVTILLREKKTVSQWPYLLN